ncbi:hypothetical protein [Catellatospora sichuanensis]|uniref:hypothetical protein n=1 Tax=Catellatospora sichuanensis TaxID=1969805 RepID=UPI00118285ED|nr:hypothetical protein [Catellatospora sichuanensis]
MKLLRRLGSFLLIAAVLAAGQAVGDATPDRNHQLRPFAVAGDFGTDVVGRDFAVRAAAVRCAAQLKIGDEILETQGVWIVVKLRLSARTEPVRIRYAAVRDASGRIYETTDRFEQYLVSGGRNIQPGLPIEGEVAIEVPAASAGDLTLLVASTYVDHRVDSMAEIPLPVSDVSGVLANPAPTEVLAPRAAS